jgi:hypothetical protein
MRLLGSFESSGVLFRCWDSVGSRSNFEVLRTLLEEFGFELKNDDGEILPGVV